MTPAAAATPTPSPQPPAVRQTPTPPASNPGQAVDQAARDIHDRLHDQGFLGTSRNDHLHEIQHTLDRLPAGERNQVIAKLSDADLKSWSGNINASGILGAEGLSHDEKRSLMKDLAGNLDGQQLARVSNAFGNRDDVVALGDAVARFGSADAKVDYVKALAPRATDRETQTDTGFGSATTLYGDKEAAAIGNVLTSLKDNPRAFNEAMGALNPAQLGAVVKALENERSTTTATYPGTASITSRFDPAPLKGLLDAAAMAGNVQNKAALFQAASGALKDIRDSDTLLTPNPSAGASVALVTQGMTQLMNSDTRGVVDRLNTVESGGASLAGYLKEVVRQDPSASNGIIGRQLAQLQGAGTGMTAEKYIGTSQPDGTGAPYYRNAQNLGYYAGAVQAGIRSLTSDAKKQGEILGNVFGTAIAVGSAALPLPVAGKVGAAAFNGLTRELIRQTVDSVASGNKSLQDAFAELALPRDPGSPERYRGAADPFYQGAANTVELRNL